ncbi:MAG: SurA N-terminal domain-containing protein [Rikenellaceae bacterium]
MATLNTLRTKFGIVLSAVIAFALLAFIFSLKSEMGFSGNDPVVATIAGENVTYTEYLAEYNEIKTQNGVDESNSDQITALENAALQSFITNKVLTPGFNKMGINVSSAERQGIINGEVPTQAFYGAFVDPSTGVYDRSAVTMFLMQASGNPQAESAWAYINEQARIEREGTKFIALLSGGVYANALELKIAAAESNKKFNGRWAGKRYSSLADSLYNVSSSEVNKYYEKNKSNYKRVPSRAVSYVAFDVNPTLEDRQEIEKTAKSVGAEFAEADDIRSFIRDNRYGSIAATFVEPSQLLAAEAEAFAAGEQFGPTLNNAKWRMSRVYETISAPDSIGITLIALPYTSQNLADSLVTALQGGADFALAAAENSVHTQSAQSGGVVGVLPFSALTTEMAQELASVKEGSIVKIEVGEIIQIIKTYDVGPATTQYRVASIEYPINASQATINKAHADAGLFAVDAKGSVSKFNDAANTHSVSVKSAELVQGEREIRQIISSREVARWAHGAKVGDISQIFKVNDGYVVAMVSKIDNSDYTSLENMRAQITRKLRDEKKFAALKSELSGASFDEQSASLAEGDNGTFEGVNFGSFYIQGLGVEPRVIGAVTSTTDVNKSSAPVKGNNGLYIFEVTEIEESAEPLSAEAVKARVEASSESMVQQMILPAITDMAGVEDLRGLYL